MYHDGEWIMSSPHCGLKRSLKGNMPIFCWDIFKNLFTRSGPFLSHWLFWSISFNLIARPMRGSRKLCQGGQLECWLGSFIFYQGIRTSIAKSPYIFWNFSGGEKNTLFPSLDPRMRSNYRNVLYPVMSSIGSGYSLDQVPQGISPSWT